MKRILGTVVAVAGVLAFSTFANAASHVFDVSGTGTVVTRSDSYATTPCGMGAVGSCFVSPLSAGSLIDVDITGGVATITNGTLEIDTFTTIAGGAITITTDVTGTLTGGLGTLVGDDILWTQPASYTAAGTLVCGSYGCSLIGLVAGDTYPIGVLNTIGGTAPVNPIILGTWDLDAGLSSILGSTRAVTSTVIADGSRAGWLVFGANDLGHTVPEPGSAALVLLGLGALALRSRKA